MTPYSLRGAQTKLPSTNGCVGCPSRCGNSGILSGRPFPRFGARSRVALVACCLRATWAERLWFLILDLFAMRISVPHERQSDQHLGKSPISLFLRYQTIPIAFDWEYSLQSRDDRLDTAVDKCHRVQPFNSVRQRLEFLFALDEQLVTPLTARPTRRRGRHNG